MTGFRVWVLAVVLVFGGAFAAAPVNVAHGASEPAPVRSSTNVGHLRPLSMTEVVAVSKKGDIVLGKLHGKYVVRNIVKNKTLRTLPTDNGPSPAYNYYGLSDDGRYVAYTRYKGSPWCAWRPWVRDTKTNRTRLAAESASGKDLSHQTDYCSLEEPGLESGSVPAISGDGRYVAFCAAEGRSDVHLFRKDLKHKTLTRSKVVCSTWGSDDMSPVRRPQISENGRVILAPGPGFSEDGFNDQWEPARLLINGRDIRESVGGNDPVLTDDGTAVYSTGPNTNTNQEEWAVFFPQRYDVASSSMSQLPSGTPVSTSMSRRGRYAINDEGTGVYDRSNGQTTPLPQGYRWYIISGDAKVVIGRSNTDQHFYALQWMA